MATSPLQIGRRGFLAGAAATGAALAVGVRDARHAHAEAVTTDPFALGVASGDPLPDGVILWTRLVRDPVSSEPLTTQTVEVLWEISTTPTFATTVRRRQTYARPRLAHSVHVDVRGLTPSTDYWYRFRVGGYVSPVGRTRTAPAVRSTPESLAIGIVNCQDWQNGYWPAYDALTQEDLDVVLHLGDYIYEYDPSSEFADRLHNPSEASGLGQLVTLNDYRNRHALYKTDPALQAAHARFPWILTWDDHETENDYADDIDEVGDSGARRQDPAQFRRQRTHAYQAYYEHMPLRVEYLQGRPDLKIYRRFDFGTLLRLNVMDTRQYRSDQPGIGSDFGPEALGEANAAGSLFGNRQEGWLDFQLQNSRAQWNVVAQQVMMSRIRFGQVAGPGSDFLANLDQWDGYAPARRRFLDKLVRFGVENPVVLAGDIHSSWFSDLKPDFDDPDSPTVASEYVATSISSDFPIAVDPQLKAANPFLNPQVKHFDGSKRGYLRVGVDGERWLCEQRSVESIATRTSPVSTTASFVTAAGTPGVVPA